MTPLDITRYNPALVNADIQHLGFYSWQLGGNRPVPGWGQYRTPVPKLYMTAGPRLALAQPSFQPKYHGEFGEALMVELPMTTA